MCLRVFFVVLGCHPLTCMLLKIRLIDNSNPIAPTKFSVVCVLCDPQTDHAKAFSLVVFSPLYDRKGQFVISCWHQITISTHRPPPALLYPGLSAQPEYGVGRKLSYSHVKESRKGCSEHRNTMYSDQSSGDSWFLRHPSGNRSSAAAETFSADVQRLHRPQLRFRAGHCAAVHIEA